MAKPKLFVVPIDVYDHTVVCMVTRDPDAIEEAFVYMNEKSITLSQGDREKIESGDGGMCWYGSRTRTVIWLGKHPRKPEEIAVLVHECIHAGVQLLHMVGVPVDAKTDEALTYVVGHLVNQFLSQMRKKK